MGNDDLLAVAAVGGVVWILAAMLFAVLALII